VSDEYLIARLRPHARAVFWPTVLLLIVAGGLGFVGALLHEQWQQIAVLVLAGLVLLFGWAAPVLRWLATGYTITSRRIVVRRGILVRSRQELLHSRGYDLTVRKNAMQSLFGSGDVLVNAGQEHPVVLRDVPKANLVLAALHDLADSQTFASDRVRR
jgi:uncharacterized membrane protein YdbT with pleckstrin-like domain